MKSLMLRSSSRYRQTNRCSFRHGSSFIGVAGAELKSQQVRVRFNVSNLRPCIGSTRCRSH